jgi:hypothetical protein
MCEPNVLMLDFVQALSTHLDMKKRSRKGAKEREAMEGKHMMQRIWAACRV